MHPDSARELKALLLQRLGTLSASAQVSGQDPAGAMRVAVGLAPAGHDRVRVAVRLEDDADRAVLPELGTAGAELDIRVVGRIRALSSPAPDVLQRRTRPLRPGLSIAHPTVTAGTLGGFVRVGGRLAVLSNNHVLAASDAGRSGDPVLQPGPADGGGAGDRVASLSVVHRLRPDVPNLADAALAVLDDGVGADPGDLPGGPLSPAVAAAEDIDPDEWVEKVGRTTGHTQGRITAVEVDGVAVQYGEVVHRFDDQVEIEGLTGAFSAGGDSGSVIWRSRGRSPLALLFAGSSLGGTAGGGLTFASPLATVLSLLGAEWCNDLPPPTARELAAGP